MLIERIENRILVGVVSFLGIMVLLGWAAINEGGRMAALANTYEARSIEQGALLFTASCSTCHGPQGRGGPKGPALNNPQLFGHDFYPEVTSEVVNLTNEKTALETELALGPTPERQAEIDARIAEITARVTEIDAPRRQTLTTAITNGYDPQRPDRLANVGWPGTRRSFIVTTLIHGRPTSISYWQGNQMVAWSQAAGGPLRLDQIEDIANYILNWDKGDAWTLDDLLAVQKFAIEPADPAPLQAQIEQLMASGGVIQTAVGTNVAAIVEQLPTVTGDPARGDALYHNQQPSFNGTILGCSGCHMPEGPGTGPQTSGTLWRTENERLADPALAGYTAERYLVESILMPGNHLVPGFNNLMLATYGTSLSLQDLADLVAYLETQNQPPQ